MSDKPDVSSADVRQECAVLRTRMAARSVTRIYEEHLRSTGLKPTQFTLLVAIKEGAPGSITVMAEHLAMERTTLTRNLKVMERDGLIKPEEGGGRAKPMRLTAAGKQKLEEALPLWRKAQDQFVAKLGDDWADSKHLLEAIARIA